jgi:hypothetical protein
LALPTWLDTVGAGTQLRFARTYVNLRATPIDEQHGYTRQLKEERTQPFIESLGELFQSLSPPETVTTGKKVIRLRPAAARELDVIPSLPGDADRDTAIAPEGDAVENNPPSS